VCDFFGFYFFGCGGVVEVVFEVDDGVDDGVVLFVV